VKLSSKKLNPSPLKVFTSTFFSSSSGLFFTGTMVSVSWAKVTFRLRNRTVIRIENLKMNRFSEELKKLYIITAFDKQI
jgi:hypothetical protein